MYLFILNDKPQQTWMNDNKNLVRFFWKMNSFGGNVFAITETKQT